jgi:hypothetical protein
MYLESMCRRSRSRGRTAKWKTEDCPVALRHWTFSPRRLPDGPFHFIFDRGCFHVFDEPEERSRFVKCVAATLEVGGWWLSLIGSTEGPPREVGPPLRTAREIVLAIEPALEIV